MNNQDKNMINKVLNYLKDGYKLDNSQLVDFGLRLLIDHCNGQGYSRDTRTEMFSILDSMYDSWKVTNSCSY